VGVSYREFKDPRKALKALEKRRRELEREFENLVRRKERGEIPEEEFEREKRRLEREFVEVMDRIAQLRFIVSGGF